MSFLKFNASKPNYFISNYRKYTLIKENESMSQIKMHSNFDAEIYVLKTKLFCF